jgi:hypothetical protein
MKTRTNLRILNGFLAFFLMISMGFAQTSENFYTITGVVRDAQTRKPVAFATVFVQGAQVGTVTNLDGAFTLKVDKAVKAELFTISHIGYKTSTFRIENFLEQIRHNLFIESSSVTLSEVVIRPDNARELVEQAINKIEVNYPNSPGRLKGFYRETIKQRRDYVAISEAIVDVDQSAYGYRSTPDRVRIIQGRKSGDVRKMDTLIVKLQGGPHVSMLLDIVKNPNILLSKEWIDSYEYELTDVVMIENAVNYVVDFKPKYVYPFPLYYGRLYISVENLGITMAEFSVDLTDPQKAEQNFIIRKPARLRFTPTRTQYLVSYKEIDGKYYLNYVRNELEFYADWRRRIFRTNYTIMSEMAITELRPDIEDRVTYRESFRRSNILADMVPVYFDEDFWGGYNVIEPDESIESAIRKFNIRIERE